MVYCTYLHLVGFMVNVDIDITFMDPMGSGMGVFMVSSMLHLTALIIPLFRAHLAIHSHDHELGYDTLSTNMAESPTFSN